MALAVVTFMLVGIIATVANSMVIDVAGIIRSESVGMASERMERAVYGMNAMDDIKLEMDYGRRYALFEEDRQRYISFTYNGEETVKPFDPPVGYTLIDEDNENPTRWFCLNKTSTGVTIYRSKC